MMSPSSTLPTHHLTAVFGTPFCSPPRQFFVNSPRQMARVPMLEWPHFSGLRYMSGCECQPDRAQPPSKGVVMNRFRIFAVLMSAFAVVSPAMGQDTKLPVQGLEQRVDFWKKVFTQYGKDDFIVHDGFYVNLIYGTADQSYLQIKMNTVRESLREIREKLGTTEPRSPQAQEIADAITAQGLPLSTASLNTLIRNLHCQQGVKERFRDGVVRSGRYVDEFQKIIKNAGVPEELALLPLVESSFENVRSNAGAVGIWQFMRSTGRQYLKISNNVDERLDLVKAATAAARMLRDNYDALGDWPIAITAYNHGRAGMMRAKDRYGSSLVSFIYD